MGGIFSNNWIITIVGTVIAAFIISGSGYIVSRLRSDQRLYNKALSTLLQEQALSPGDKSLLKQVLKDAEVVRWIRARASDPDEEAQCLYRAIMYHALSSNSQFADSTKAALLAERLLQLKFEKEGHKNNSDREPYFKKPAIPGGLTANVTSQRIMLTWNSSGSDYIWQYHIARSTNANGPFSEVGIVPANAGNLLSFTDEKDIRDGTTYYYTVTVETKVLKRAIASISVSARPEQPAIQESSLPESSSVLSGTFFAPDAYWYGKAADCVDRQQEMESLHGDFANSDRRLLLIEGFDGLGKTNIAARLAKDVSQHYNILWVNCKGIPVTEEGLLRELGKFAFERYKYSALAEIVQSSRLSPDEKENGLIRFLDHVSKARRMSTTDEPIHSVAMFFDDYHHVMDAHLKQLILKIAQCDLDVKVVLVTHSRPPELQTPLGASSARLIKGFLKPGCREFIEMYAKKSEKNALKNLDAETLDRIWERTGRGVPAAIEMLITMTETGSINKALRQLPEKYSDWLAPVFAKFSVEERQVAREISIFRRPPSEDAVSNVSQCANVDNVLDMLVRHRYVLAFEDGKYAMQALWAEYTRRLLAPAEARELHMRAALFYRNVTSNTADEEPNGELMSRLESCYHFIKAGATEQAEEVLQEIAGTLRRQGLFQECLDSLGEIEKSGKALAPALILEKGAILYARGQVQAGIEILNDLVAKENGEIGIQARNELGWIYIEIGKRRDAENLLKESRELAQQLHFPMLEVEALHGLQHLTYHECEYDQVLAYNRDALRILEQMDNSSNKEDILKAKNRTEHEIGNVYRERGFYSEALERYRRNLEFLQSQKESTSRDAGWTIYDIGQIYRDLTYQGLKEPQDAIIQLKKAEHIFATMGFSFGLAHVKIELGRVGAMIDTLSDAPLKEVQDTIELLQQIKAEAAEAYAWCALGEIYRRRGKSEEALKCLKQSLDMETKLGSKKGIAAVEHQMSLVYEQQGKRVSQESRIEACNYFSKALKAIYHAQDLYTAIGTIPSIRGIDRDAERIKLALEQHECESGT